MPSWRAVVTIDHPSLGGRGTNTWHVRSASTVIGDVTEADALLQHIKTFYNNLLSINPSGTVIAWDGVLAGVGPNEGSFGQGTVWSVTTTTGGAVLPPSNSICVNWRGQSGDRSRRGRTFLGPINTGCLEGNGTINAFQLAEVRTAATALVNASTAFNNGAIGVWSRQEGLFRDFVASSVADKFASLRSRRD